MKTGKKYLFAILTLACLLPLTGCSSLLGGPPTAVERTIFTTVTNYVPQVVQVTNVTTLTNTVVTQVTQTNGITLYNTNTVLEHTLQVVTETNIVPVYQLTTSANTQATATAAGGVLNTFFPGVGSLVAPGILALLAIWGRLRSNKLGDTAAAVSQEVETLREFIQALPNGTKYDAAITSWLQSHQLETGTAVQVVKLLEDRVSNPDAKAAAAEISATLTALGTVVPKA
jgi:hypothetical protein